MLEYIERKTNQNPSQGDSWKERVHGNARMLYDGKFQYAPWQGTNPPTTSVPSEAQLDVVDNTLQFLADILESRTKGVFSIKRLPENQHGSHNLGVFDSPGLTPPGVNYGDENSSNGNIVDFGYIAPEAFLVGRRGVLDETIQPIFLQNDLGDIYVFGSNEEPEIPDKYKDMILLSYTVACMPRMGFND